MTGSGFDPADPKQRVFAAYGPAPLPDPRDDVLSKFVDQVESKGPAAVGDTVAHASERGRSVLRAYGARLASLAVRRKDSGLLVRATIAVVLGGLDQNAREALMVMPLIENSARLLNADLPGIFEDAAEVVGHPGTVNLMLWLTRSPEDRTIACMGFEESSDEGGFRYKSSASKPRDQSAHVKVARADIEPLRQALLRVGWRLVDYSYPPFEHLILRHDGLTGDIRGHATGQRPIDG